MGAMVSWGSQEESGEAEAACWPVGSLLSVTPAKTVQEAGLFSPAKAGLDQPLRLFLTAFSPPPPTPALTSLSLGQAATGFLVHPHTPRCHGAFAFRPFAHTLPTWKALGLFSRPTSSFFSKTYLFTWLPWVLVASRGIFVAVCGLL